MAPQIMMMMMMNSSSAESSSPSGGGGGGGGGEEEERWRHFDNSVNAVSFGFVATAILISMFLVMAIFERFLRPPTSPSSSSSSSQGIINDQVGRRRRRRRRGGSSSPSFAFAAAFDLESQHHHRNFAPKLDYPSSSPKMSIYAKGVSVLMPGNDIPTYIAHPAPAPCPPERILWPPHDHNYFPIVGSTSS